MKGQDFANIAESTTSVAQLTSIKRAVGLVKSGKEIRKELLKLSEKTMKCIPFI